MRTRQNGFASCSDQQAVPHQGMPTHRSLLQILHLIANILQIVEVLFLQVFRLLELVL